MALKTNVIDRVPTYPGRVKMTPVSGQANTYDLERADSPVVEGTPINAELLNKKADVLANNTMIHVNGGTGSDIVGDGSSGAPYATIQAAIDSVPKCLNGHKARIHVAGGTYVEDVVISGFYGGELEIMALNLTVRLKSVSVASCSLVRMSALGFGTSDPAFIIANNADTGDGLFVVDKNSNVILTDDVTLSSSSSVNGVLVSGASTLVAEKQIHVSNVGLNAVVAKDCSTVSANRFAGTGNKSGLKAEQGGVIVYGSHGLTSTNGDSTASGGRIGNGSGNFSLKLTLNPASWTGTSAPYTQTISAAGVLATDEPIVDVYLQNVDNTSAASVIEAWSYIGRITTTQGFITAYCYTTKPTVSIPINVKVVR